jgi:hypothetical protein
MPADLRLQICHSEAMEPNYFGKALGVSDETD